MADGRGGRGLIAESCGAFPLIASGGVFLRLLQEDDAPELQALIEANRANLSRWLPWAGGQTLEDTAGFIRATRKQLVESDGFQTAIACEESIAGVVGFVGVDWQNGSTNVGYWLGEDQRGKGIMTKAVRALAGHAFSVWNLNRVEIRVAIENRPSRAIPERLGFRQDGILRAAQLVQGRYFDLAVYSMLAADWNPTP
jgi:ribosomal-protein-serine acetyltransferase